MKLALVGSLVAASLLVGCYMVADNGFMAKGWKPGDQASWSAEITKRNQSQSEYSRIK